MQAALLRSGRLSEADIANLAEEIESIGSSQKAEIRRRLARLLQHLLKWRYQPELQSRSWSTTIMQQRDELLDLLASSPSLRPYIAEAMPRSYRKARLWALDETGLLRLPEECEWSAEQVMQLGFLPNG